MSNAYLVRLETQAKSIKTRRDLVAFYKKIVSLKDYVDDVHFEYWSEKESEGILGSIVLNKDTFQSLYQSAAQITDGHNADFYKVQAQHYGLNYSMSRQKGSDRIDMRIEDISTEFYVYPSERLYSAKVPFFIILYRALFVRFPRLPFLKNLKEIDLFFVKISFDQWQNIRKNVEANNSLFIKFIEKVIGLYNVKKAVGGNFNDTVMEWVADMFEYSKVKGLIIYQKILPFP